MSYAQNVIARGLNSFKKYLIVLADVKRCTARYLPYTSIPSKSQDRSAYKGKYCDNCSPCLIRHGTRGILDYLFRLRCKIQAEPRKAIDGAARVSELDELLVQRSTGPGFISLHFGFFQS